VSLLAITFASLPRLALPVAGSATMTGCTCGERGSAVVFDAATVEREPAIVVAGDVCNAESVVCLHRDAKDRCDTFWIVPIKEGRCIFTARFSDRTEIEEAIDYDVDGEYPCRGNVRPRHDHVTRINSGT
jgi:hypothetical protein